MRAAWVPGAPLVVKQTAPGPQTRGASSSRVAAGNRSLSRSISLSHSRTAKGVYLPGLQLLFAHGVDALHLLRAELQPAVHARLLVYVHPIAPLILFCALYPDAPPSPSVGRGIPDAPLFPGDPDLVSSALRRHSSALFALSRQSQLLRLLAVQLRAGLLDLVAARSRSLAAPLAARLSPSAASPLPRKVLRTSRGPRSGLLCPAPTPFSPLCPLAPIAAPPPAHGTVPPGPPRPDPGG